MGLSDKLKQIGDKAKDAAAEHRDQIQQAVESAGAIADRRTKGKYTDKIAKATTKTEGYVDRLAPQEAEPAPAGREGGRGRAEGAGPAGNEGEPGPAGV